MEIAKLMEATPVTWESLIPNNDAEWYQRVLHQALDERLPFALGGGLAWSIYTGKLRNTKDLDLYILPSDRERTIQLVTRCGLADYYDVSSYDRAWIYRAHRGNVLVDTIWAMANQRVQVDEQWLENGPLVRLFGEEFRIIPPEELIWSKIYVLQRDRCDWPDILNLLNAIGEDLDWDHLLDRVSDDAPLIKALLSIFSWLNPEPAARIPRWVWEHMSLPLPQAGEEAARRPHLLDTRPWFWHEDGGAKAGEGATELC